MRTDWIAEVGIDEGGSLWVKPATAAFPYIYREGKEIRWDAQRLRLYSPKPWDWSYVAWFNQIRDAAREQGVELEIGAATSWSGLESELRKALIDGG